MCELSLASRRVRVQDSPLGERSSKPLTSCRAQRKSGRLLRVPGLSLGPTWSHAVLASCVVHSFVGGVAAPRSQALRHTACTNFPPVFATVGEPALDQDIDVK